MTQVKPRPLATSDRILSIDILRGLALFGVLMVNLLMEFRISIFEQFLSSSRPMSLLDQMVAEFVSYALDMKSFSLFSLLFGLGLAAQFDRLSQREKPRYWLQRRLWVLLGLGLVHILFIWNGDILTEYALAGLLVLPLLHADKDSLKYCSLALLCFYVLMPAFFVPVYWPTNQTFAAAVDAAYRTYPNGDLLEIMRFSIGELKLIIPMHIGIFPRTLSLMLLGAWVWKSGLLAQLRVYRRLLTIYGLLVTAIGVGITVAVSSNVFLRHPLVADMALRLGAPLQATGYAALIVILVDQPRIRPLLKVFAPLGRMAFTNYIAQSFIFAWIFYGYGLGQFGRLGIASSFLLGGIIYIAQVMGSILWFRWFRFGPLEWLWRSLTYGQRQAMWKSDFRLRETTT